MITAGAPGTLPTSRLACGVLVPRPRFPKGSSVILVEGNAEPDGVVENTSEVGCEASVQFCVACTDIPPVPVRLGPNAVAPYPLPPNLASVSPVCTAEGARLVPRALRPKNDAPNPLPVNAVA